MSGAATAISGRVGRIIAVHSAKGGVGKSTIAAGLAQAMRRAGARVGVLDADLHGPSLPTLLGGMPDGEPELSANGRQVSPWTSDEGIVCQSFAYVARMWRRRLGDGSIVLRGPLIAELATQMANHTRWGQLDALLIDMPPGTGEVPLALASSLPIDAAVVVSTPHALALADVVKGIEMLEKLNIAVGAVVHNMATFTCSGCGSEHRPFGPSAEDALRARLPSALLLDLPIAVPPARGGDAADDTAARVIIGAGAPCAVLAPRFDELAGALLLGEGSHEGAEASGALGHLLPAPTDAYSVPHWPTLMATAKLELK